MTFVKGQRVPARGGALRRLVGALSAVLMACSAQVGSRRASTAAETPSSAWASPSLSSSAPSFFASSSTSAPASASASASAIAKKPFTIERIATCAVPNFPPASAVPLVTDVAYGPDAKQTLDYALPSLPATPGVATKPAPIVMIIHGGGWTSGRKSLFASTLRMLSRQGYFAASIDYRLAGGPKTAFPTQVQDVRCAARWLLSHASTLGADGSGLLLMGASAGGHLAALLGAASDAPQFVGGGCTDEGPVRVKGVLSYYAPLELRDTQKRYPPIMHAAVEEFFRLPPKTPAWLRASLQATPATWLDGDDPPMLLIHGTGDPIVPIDDARRFDRALAGASIPHLLVEVAGQGHGFPVFAGVPPVMMEPTCTALGFLAAASKKRD